MTIVKGVYLGHAPVWYATTAPPGVGLRHGGALGLSGVLGTDTSTDLWWGYASPVWNDSGDTATLTNDAGSTVDAYSY